MSVCVKARVQHPEGEPGTTEEGRERENTRAGVPAGLRFGCRRGNVAPAMAFRSCIGWKRMRRVTSRGRWREILISGGRLVSGCFHADVVPFFQPRCRIQTLKTHVPTSSIQLS